MRFTVQFGKSETNLLEFSFNQLMGTSVIKLNDQVVKRQTRWFSEPIHQTHFIEAGTTERWRIKIEKERKLLFGQRCRVFLNQQLAGLYEGV
jgi:hypothetical protein